jgi:hypothetical protein
MTFRHLLLICGCAAVVAVSPSGRNSPVSMSASVVWGARTSWTYSTPTKFQLIRDRAPHARAAQQE